MCTHRHTHTPTTASPQELSAEAVSFVANDINKVFEGFQEMHYL